MKWLEDIETDNIQMVVFECDCGFHIGIDFSFIDQIEDLKVPCPACGSIFDTAILYPEVDPDPYRGLRLV